MNRITGILIVIVLLNSCISKEPKKVIALATIIEKINPTDLKVKSGNFYSIKIELFNNTDTVFDFWTMTCSWQSNWVFEDKNIQFFVNCPKNYPLVSQIKPHQRVIYNGIIELVDTLALMNNHYIKVGFVLVKKNDVAEESDFIQMLWNKSAAKKDIIWSEPFKIDK